MIALDNTVLVNAFCGPRVLGPAVRATLVAGEFLTIPLIAYYEWCRGPRSWDDLRTQEGVVPRQRVLGFGVEEAELAAEFFRTLPRARARTADFLIAASAITHGARLWTQNRADFEDIPGLVLFEPPAT